MKSRKKLDKTIFVFAFQKTLIFFISVIILLTFSSCYEKKTFVKLNQTSTSLVEKLSTLITYKSVTNNFQEAEKVINWINEQISGLPVHITKLYNKNYPAILITTQKTKTPKIWLVAHLDVVPAKEDLFIPKIENNKIIGRGVYDMKMAIAAFVGLFQELGPDLEKYDIGIMIPSDEEIGGFNGTKFILNSGYSSEIALIPDGGYNWKIEEEAKGVLMINIMAKGEASHSSRPWEGDNAIQKLLPIFSKITDIFDNKAIHKNKINPNVDFFTTCNLSIIKGGDAMNQVPNHAEGVFDIRYVSTDDPQQIIRKINNVIKETNISGVKSIIKHLEPGHKVDLSTKEIISFKNIAEKLYNIKIGTMKSHGSSDARFFGAKNIPALLVAPIGGNHHGEVEWLDIDDFFRFYNVVKDWVIENGKI
jgi:succinyl-diaminopimelate desuccinylase